jgi:hypothetical protein
MTNDSTKPETATEPYWRTSKNPIWQDTIDAIASLPVGERIGAILNYTAHVTDAVVDCAWAGAPEFRCLPVGAEGVVYFAVAEGSQDAAGRMLVKIGHTTGEASARIASLQTGCPHRLYVARVSPGSPAAERELHLALTSRRVHGEWFRLTNLEIETLSTYVDGDCHLGPIGFCGDCACVHLESSWRPGVCFDCSKKRAEL